MSSTAEWPDVTATAHDGGHGFLVAWREAGLGAGLTTVAISGKGAVDATAVVPGGDFLPGVAPLPEGQVFVAARDPGFSLSGSVVDASSLAVLEEPAVTFDGPITGYSLELAVSQIAEVAMVYTEPWNDATMSLPVKACVLHPQVACIDLGDGTTPSYSAVARQAGHFVAAIPTLTGFDLVRFDADGPAGTLSVDEPFTWLGPHLAPRPGGGFVLAWQSPDLCVRFRLLSEDLVPEGALGAGGQELRRSGRTESRGSPSAQPGASSSRSGTCSKIPRRSVVARARPCLAPTDPRSRRPSSSAGRTAPSATATRTPR